MQVIIMKELLSDLAILSSLLFLYTQVTSTSPLSRSSSRTRKIIIGLFGGLLSNILMQYSMNIGNTIIDLRHIPIIIMAYYGGFLPTLSAGLLIIFGRFLFGFNTSSFAAIFLVTFISAAALLISRRQLSKKKKIFWMVTFSNLVFTVLVFYLLNDIKLLLHLIPIYWGISYLAGFISFSIIEYIRRSQELFNQYKAESATDGLTGLNNFRKFDEVFNQLMFNQERTNEKISLLYIDIDYFKKINDTYGHAEGDIVLKELASILKSSTRSFDIVSRNGGEEFTAILRDCGLNQAIEISELIRKNVEDFTFILNSGHQINITVSIGIANFDETTKHAADLIDDADKALYQAKKNGRNRVYVSQ
ncbi:diguanylate cyclase [Sediminibacillus dalangtanensis]|uniref:Diguanylate cyclase n=2 Tax=Sediminibacillus dalangtanensis TaxID=2729421 RepID=A0ABX7W2I3_9BACI|nr:diguanylate cyclase [Sediminibacillus dalangtanensis]